MTASHTKRSSDRALAEINATWNHTDAPEETQGRYLTPDGLAARLGIPVRTIRNWREAAVNKGPLGVRFGKHIRYLISDVEAWEAQEREAGRTRPGRQGKAADQ